MYRLNPFALPSETNGRFSLLILGALVLTFVLARAVVIGGLNLEPAFSADIAEVTSLQQFQLVTAEYLRYLFVLLCSTTIPIVLLFVGAGAVYRQHVGRLIWRQKLQPWPTAKDQKFQQAFSDSARSLGLSQTPQIYTPENSRDMSGQAFGVPPKYAVVLGGRMPLMLRKRPQVFRAIVAHELAHIVNGDIQRTYFTQALWLLTIIFVLMPLTLSWIIQILGAIFTGFTAPETGFVITVSVILSIVTQFIAFVLVFSLARSSVLRIREEYADWRAAIAGNEQSLLAILEAAPKPNLLTWLTFPWWLHPLNATRIKTLKNVTNLFKLRFDLPIVAGFLLGMTLVLSETLGLTFVYTSAAGWSTASRAAINQFMETSGPIRIGLALVFIPLIIGSLIAPFILTGVIGIRSIGVQLQRHALGRLAMLPEQRKLSLRLPISALLFTISIGAGILLLPFNPLTAPILDFLLVISAFPAVLFQYVAEQILWVISFTGLMWVWFVLCQLWSRWSLGRHQGEEGPGFKRSALNWVQALTLGLLLLSMLLGQSLVSRNIVGFGFQGASTVALVIMIGSLLLSAGLSVGYSLVLLVGSGFNQPLTCKACQTPSKHRVAVGQFCDACGEPLARWLYVQLDEPPV